MVSNSPRVAWTETTERCSCPASIVFESAGIGLHDRRRSAERPRALRLSGGRQARRQHQRCAPEPCAAGLAPDRYPNLNSTSPPDVRAVRATLLRPVRRQGVENADRHALCTSGC